MNSVACPSCCSIIRTKHRSVSRRRAQVRAMRAIVQRVSSASVEVCSKSISLSFLSYITSAKLQFAGGGAHCIGDWAGSVGPRRRSRIRHRLRCRLHVSFLNLFLFFIFFFKFKFLLWIFEFEWLNFADVGRCWTWGCSQMRLLAEHGTKA